MGVHQVSSDTNKTTESAKPPSGTEPTSQLDLPLALEVVVIVGATLKHFDFLLRSLKGQELNEALGLTVVCKTPQKEEVNELFRQIELTRVFSQQIIVEDTYNFPHRRNLVFKNTRSSRIYFLDEKTQLLFTRHLSYLIAFASSSSAKTLALSGPYLDGNRVDFWGSVANMIASMALVRSKKPFSLLSGNLLLKVDHQQRLDRLQIKPQVDLTQQEGLFFQNLQKEGFVLLANNEFAVGRNTMLDWKLFKKEYPSKRLTLILHGVSIFSIIKLLSKRKGSLEAKLTAFFYTLIGGL